MNVRHELRNRLSEIKESVFIQHPQHLHRLPVIAVIGGVIIVIIIASGGLGIRVVVGICRAACESHLACNLTDRDRVV